MMTKILLCSLVGGILGVGMQQLSRRMIRSRTGYFPRSLLYTVWAMPLWFAVCGAAGAVIGWLADSSLACIEALCIFVVLSGISAVDFSIRKIPNELLLAMLCIKLLSVVISADYPSLLPALAGMVCGLVLFAIPSRMGVNIGLGDVKLAGAIGFFLGVTGLLQSVLVMGAVLGAYALYLVLSRRGTLRSKVALGPVLSLGMLVSMLFPITANIML